MGKRPFVNANCCAVPPGWQYLSMLARRSCIRRAGHPPPCRNRIVEWEAGQEVRRRSGGTPR